MQTGFIHPYDCARQPSTVPFYHLSLELGKIQQKPFVTVVSGIFRDPQQRDPLPILFPNPTPIFESLKDMGIVGIVWETCHKIRGSLKIPGIAVAGWILALLATWCGRLLSLIEHTFAVPWDVWLGNLEDRDGGGDDG